MAVVAPSNHGDHRLRAQARPLSKYTPHGVWNLEVEGQPVYHVTKRDLYVHNISAQTPAGDSESILDWLRSKLGKSNKDVLRFEPSFWIPRNTPHNFKPRVRAPIEMFSEEQLRPIYERHTNELDPNKSRFIDFRNPENPQRIQIGTTTLDRNWAQHAEEGTIWANKHAIQQDTSSPQNISAKTARQLFKLLYSGGPLKTPRIYEFLFLELIPNASRDVPAHTTKRSLDGVHIHQAPLASTLGVQFVELRPSELSNNAMGGLGFAYNPATNAIFTHSENLAHLPPLDASKQIAVAAFSARRNAYGFKSPIHVNGYPAGTDVSDIFAWQISQSRAQQRQTWLWQFFMDRNHSAATPTTQHPVGQ